MVRLIIDNCEVVVPDHTTILDAAKSVGIQIPTLCYLRDLNEIGGCRVCVVEVEGCDQLVAACNNYVLDGMVVRTNSPKAREARRTNVQLLLSQHDSQCTSCVRSGNCNLQTIANDLGIFYLPYQRHLAGEGWDFDFPIIRENDKCIKCMRCIKVCESVQGLGIWDLTNRATHTAVGTAGVHRSARPIASHAASASRIARRARCASATIPRPCLTRSLIPIRSCWCRSRRLCVALGARNSAFRARRPPSSAWLARCAAWALSMCSTPTSRPISPLWRRLRAARAPEQDRQGRGRQPRLAHVYELLPGWVRFAKARYPEFVDSLSTSKSPQQMFGAIAKTYYAKVLGVEPERLFVVSVMPCTAKKAECALPSMVGESGAPDVDVALTVREMVRMIRASHVSVDTLVEEPLDTPLGFGTGAGVIFGATGGVMEAAVRSAYYLVTGKNPDADFFTDVRGLDGWKEAVADIDGTKVRVAVAHGLGNAARLLDAIRDGRVSYDFVEVMACPGGCVGGGGQPIHDGCELAAERGQVLWGLDANAEIRFSHENPDVQACYSEFLGAPLSPLAEELLHTDHHAWTMPNEGTC